MSQIAAAAPNAATDTRIDPEVRSFLAVINKDIAPFWERHSRSRSSSSPTCKSRQPLTCLV
jgi:hypothetical protein